MNSPDSKRLSDTISSAASMTLFLFFTVCCLIIISAAVSAYGRISSNYEDTFNSAAAVRYVTNKLRSCDGAEVSENGLILYDEGFCTVIYESGGTVYERLFPEGREISFDGGEAVFKAEGYSVTDCGGGLLQISAKGSGGDVFSTYCRIPKGGAPA